MTPEEVYAYNEQTSRAYQVLFASAEGKIVLADLAAYCGARISTFDKDPHEHARNAGRREVFLRIHEWSSLTLEEIYALRTPRIKIQTGDDQ